VGPPAILIAERDPEKRAGRLFGQLVASRVHDSAPEGGLATLHVRPGMPDRLGGGPLRLVVFDAMIFIRISG